MNRCFALTLTIASFAASLPSAKAAVITESLDLSGTRIYGQRSPAFLTSITPFDPSLGVLTGVAVQLVGTVAPGVVVSDPPSPLPAPLVNPVTFSNPTIALFSGFSSAGTVSSTQTLPTETGSFGSGADASQLAAIGAPEAVDLVNTLPNDALAEFGQFPSIEITFNPNPSDLGIPYIGPPYLNFSFTPAAELTTTFTYTPTATPVPEPALLSLGLLGAGAAWLAFARRQPRILA